MEKIHLNIMNLKIIIPVRDTDCHNKKTFSSKMYEWNVLVSKKKAFGALDILIKSSGYEKNGGETGKRVYFNSPFLTY